MMDTDAYELTLAPLSGATPLVFTGNLRDSGQPISEVSLVIYSNGSSADGSRELYVNHLRITQLNLPGDANQDGLVDVADFNIWNDHRGELEATWSVGDFNDNGNVDDLDFDIWNANKFVSASPAASVPENANPVWCLLVFLAAFATCSRIRD
jgi:hypothetical protein